MKKSKLEVYALAVCFATIVCFVVSLGVALYSVVEIMSPGFTMNSYEYGQYQSNDAYWQRHSHDYWNAETKGPKKPSEDELTKHRNESYQLAIMAEKRGGFQTVTKAAIIIVIDTIVFLIHWLIARRSRESNSAA